MAQRVKVLTLAEIQEKMGDNSSIIVVTVKYLELQIIHWWYVLVNSRSSKHSPAQYRYISLMGEKETWSKYWLITGGAKLLLRLPDYIVVL